MFDGLTPLVNLNHLFVFPSLSQFNGGKHCGNACMMHTLNTLATCLTAASSARNVPKETNQTKEKKETYERKRNKKLHETT